METRKTYSIQYYKIRGLNEYLYKLQIFLLSVRVKFALVLNIVVMSMSIFSNHKKTNKIKKSSKLVNKPPAVALELRTAEMGHRHEFRSWQ